MLKNVSKNNTKRRRIIDDKNIFVVTNFVSIVVTSPSSISNYTKYIDLPKSSKYRLFNKYYGK